MWYLHLGMFLVGVIGAMSTEQSIQRQFHGTAPISGPVRKYYSSVNPYRNDDLTIIDTPHQPSHYEHFHEEILYPCEIYNWACIRSYLASNSDCRPVYGPVSDPLSIPKARTDFFAANITTVSIGPVFEGLKSAKIKEFYHNKRSGNVVIAFHIEDLSKTGPASYIYHRKAKEPIVLSDKTSFTIPSVLLTATIPSAGSSHLRLEAAEHTSYVVDPHIVHDIGSKIYKSNDPEVMYEFSTFMANLPLMMSEYVSQIAKMINTVLIQQNLCDFGVRAF